MEGDDGGLIPVNHHLGNYFCLQARGTPLGVQTTNDANEPNILTCLSHAIKVYRPYSKEGINPKQL